MKKIILFLLVSATFYGQNSSRLDSIAVSKIKITTTPTTSAGSYSFLTYNATTDEVEQVASSVGLQDLQETINNGQIYSTNDDRSYGMIGGIDESYTGGVTRFYETDSIGNTGLLSLNKSEILLLNDTPTTGSAISINDGDIEIAKSDYSIPADNRLKFKTPTVTTTTYIPARSVAGNYMVNTTSETTYTVSTLPAGVLNDMAIVTDALSPTFLTPVAGGGGGAVVCTVWHNGTTWVFK